MNHPMAVCTDKRHISSRLQTTVDAHVGQTEATAQGWPIDGHLGLDQGASNPGHLGLPPQPHAQNSRFPNPIGSLG